MNKKFEILKPSCNIDTITDGRGGIFTWLPKEPILEFNMLYFNPGKIRGFHYHPHFVEYVLVVEGNGVMVVKEDIRHKFVRMGQNPKEEISMFCLHHSFVLLIKLLKVQ